jgi:hypothetical protein
MILFFDTYIVASFVNHSGGLNNVDIERVKLLNNIRISNTIYNYCPKIDIVKYTLSSYKLINWSKVFIRFECEDDNDTNIFFKFCKDLFPNAFIENKRSTTESDFHKALYNISTENPWVFFSPNNDHPFLNKPENFENLFQVAEKYEKLNISDIVSIQYSHFTESQTTISPLKHEWGANKNFCKIIEKNDSCFVVRNQFLLADSIKIFRLHALLSFFKLNETNKRVIRIEDTNVYRNKKITEITIIPREELCRHYDGYTHIITTPPPLFIPNGFFENKIKIKYGYDKYYDGYVNINPNQNKYIFEGGFSDLICTIKQIPFFWKNRIVELDINHNFKENENNYYTITLLDPWYNKSVFNNILLSIKRIIIANISQTTRNKFSLILKLLRKIHNQNVYFY